MIPNGLYLEETVRRHILLLHEGFAVIFEFDNLKIQFPNRNVQMLLGLWKKKE